MDDLLAGAHAWLDSRRGNHTWRVSSEDDKWEALHAAVAAVEFEQPVLFAGSLFDQAQVELALAVLDRNSVRAGVGFLTSGSTGEPKLVVHDSSALVAAALSLASHLDLEGVQAHHLFPPNYMAGVLNCVLLPLVTEGVICLDKIFSFETPFTISRTRHELRSDFAWLSPRMIASLSARMRKDSDLRQSLRAWHCVASATGPLAHSVRENFQNLTGTPVLNTYGTTEHLFITAERTPGVGLTCGVPLPNVHLRLRQELGSICSNETGAPLDVASPWTTRMVIDLASGEPVPWEEHVLGPCRPTGDLALWSGKTLKIQGRADDLVVVDGINFSARRFEDVAQLSQEVVEAYCFMGVSGTGHEALILILEIPQESRAHQVEATVRTLLRERLPHSPLVKRVIARHDWPKTASGKLDRRSISQTNFLEEN
jgi:acyl-coenzyme A synthetase/AMP-(fatty) acid ligase